MFIIECPWCGKRDQSEFSYGGEAHITRPKDNEKMSDAEWADYLFNRSNPKGLHFERWAHSHGCGMWFNAARDTQTDEFLEFYKMGEKPSTKVAGGSKKK
jgi:heterotetrameric sarcosine oxidase delta subunit